MSGRIDAIGWFSQLEVGLGTKKRLVLHGNVLDLVTTSREAAPVPLREYLRHRLERAGYRRIVAYDHDRRPEVLRWDDLDLSSEEGRTAAWTAFAGRPTTDPAEPAVALELVRAMLASGAAPAAAVVSNAELRVQYPSAAAVRLHELTPSAARVASPDPGHPDRALQNLAVHIYARESSIPVEFVTSDPEAKLIFVPPPSLAQRRAFLSWSLRGRAEPDPERLARATEGYRLRELDQLVALSSTGGRDIDALLREFRHGRRLDAWRETNIDAAAAQLARAVEGQEQAVEAVVAALRRAKHRTARIIDPTARRPALVLFFVGATGVGKTLLARAIASAVTGSEENLKIFDMSEYRQDHADQRLIGPPPGYVGHLQGGQLTNWIKERPHSVVLFDEVEKAHERILDIFLQILDGARLTDGKGETVDLGESIIIFTSNIGTADVDQVGIDRDDPAAVRAYFAKAVEEYFRDEIGRPELFNKMGRAIVAFGFIRAAVARRVVEQKLAALIAETGSRTAREVIVEPFDVERDRALVDRIVERMEYQAYGLRDANTWIELCAGTGAARFLDEEAGPGRYRFVWDEHDATAAVRRRLA